MLSHEAKPGGGVADHRGVGQRMAEIPLCGYLRSWWPGCEV